LNKVTPIVSKQGVKRSWYNG